MSKSDYTIRQITKKQSEPLLMTYHYLKDISRGFKSGFNYGLFYEGNLVGVIIYTGLPVPNLVTGMFGLERNDQDGFFELSRLCIHPDIQSKEHNITSWFVSKSIKQLRKDTKVRAILSYADADHHSGVIYAACNFKYYGLTSPKSDFYIKQGDGSYIKHSRGPVKHLEGEWRERSRKHRFVIIFDKTLNIKWNEEKWSNNGKSNKLTTDVHTLDNFF